MALKKDKQKVLGEVFDDDRLKSFFNIQPPEGVDANFHILEKAYRGMGEDNFTTFVQFYVEAGRDINVTNPDGKTLLQIIETHPHAGAYIEALKGQGAS